MAFEEIETGASAPPQAKLSYLRGQRGKNGEDRSKKPKLIITIPTTICGISKSEKFALLVGTGDDRGKILIRGCDAKPKPKGAAVAPTQHKHYFRFHFGYVPRLGDSIFDEKGDVRRISDEEFEIIIPESLFDEAESDE